MKFGKQIRDKSLPEWAMHYMDYKGLKKIIGKCIKAQAQMNRYAQASSPASMGTNATVVQEKGQQTEQEKRMADAQQDYQTSLAYLFFLLQRQLEKVAELFVGESSLLQARTLAISDKVNQLAVETGTLPEDDFRRHTVAQLLGGINDILTIMHKLNDFSKMNMDGFRKILKKLDKKLGTKYADAYMTDRVAVSSFANCKEALQPIQARAKQLKERLERLLGVRPSIAASNLMFSQFAEGSELTLPSGMHLAQAHNLAELLKSNDLTALDKALQEFGPAQRPPLMDDLLYHACRAANSEAIKYCLKHQANTLHHIEPHGYTSWHILVRHDNTEQLELLCTTVTKRICRKAFSEIDSLGRTILHLAAAHNQVNSLRLLVQHGADINVMNSSGISPLLSAITANNTEAALVIIELKADVDLFNSELSTCLSPLALASQLGNATIVEALLKAGADDLLKDSEGELALHKACARGHADVVKLLVQHNPSVVHVRDEYELQTPLFLCAKYFHEECAQVLLDHGACPNVRDVNGWTPHSYAMYYGYIYFGERLIAQGQKMAHQDHDHEVVIDKGLSTTAQPCPPLAPHLHTNMQDKRSEATMRGSPLAPPVATGPQEVSTRDLQGSDSSDSELESSSDHTTPEILSTEPGPDGTKPNMVANPRGGFDVTSFIDKEGEYRVRGDEKTVSLCRRAYGHDYLRDQARVFVDMSPLEAASFGLRVVDSDGLKLGLHQCFLQCAVAFHTVGDDHDLTMPEIAYKSLSLPLSEDGDSYSFDVPVQDIQNQCTFEFRLVSVFNPSDVVACARLPARHWQRTDEEHSQHQVTLLDRQLRTVCSLHFRYLVVLPYQSGELRITPETTYWTTYKQIPVWGHRGTGSSKAAHVDTNTYRTHVQENTVLSFVTAANLGAEYVEFDVQLTSDQVPVIYHNWTLAEVVGFDIPVDMITLNAFLALKERRRDDIARFGQDSDSRLSVREKKGSNNNNDSSGTTRINTTSGDASTSTSNSPVGPGSEGNGDTPSPFDAHEGGTGNNDASTKSHLQQQQKQRLMNGRRGKPGGSRPRAYSNPELSSVEQQGLDIDPKRYVRAPLATLEEALTLVPESLGFNIEIKYPLIDHQIKHKLQSWEMNTFVDTTLDVVFRHAGNRKIVFSCFHPDMCRVLSLKQPCYPVLFLTSAGYEDNFVDMRAMSLRAAVRFASSANLLGIVSNCHPLVLCPELIHQVKSSGLLLLTWGRENNDVESVRLQEACGVDAVIVDHIAHIRKGLRPRAQMDLM
eukprot:m.80084 g.80084  ORF g.80084 m.80084 type:complete len:1265 (+) comp14190_c0_seq2:239-4033(+)